MLQGFIRSGLYHVVTSLCDRQRIMNVKCAKHSVLRNKLGHLF